MVFWWARAWEVASPGLDPVEWLRVVMAELDAKFRSWKMPQEEDDLCGCADPQLVAALEFIAALIPDEDEPPPVAARDS